VPPRCRNEDLIGRKQQKMTRENCWGFDGSYRSKLGSEKTKKMVEPKCFHSCNSLSLSLQFHQKQSNTTLFVINQSTSAKAIQPCLLHFFFPLKIKIRPYIFLYMGYKRITFCTPLYLFTPLAFPFYPSRYLESECVKWTYFLEHRSHAV
jgi:hypothetical protein